MCPMDQKIACQLAFIPITSTDYRADVRHVIDLIKTSQLTYKVGTLSTEISGDTTDVMNLIHRIVEEMDSRCGFSFQVTFSNVCGRDA